VSRFVELARSARAPGIAMTVGTIAALVWANVATGSYSSIWATGRPWVNEALMALFFLGVGVEVRREMIAGELASIRRAAAPIVGALGGMLVPALIFAAIVRGPGLPEGHAWGIPMATDIAFAVGVLALIGSRSVRERTFLMTLAVADDVLAIVVLVAFYGGGVSLGPMIGFVAGLVIPSTGLGPRRVEHTLLPWVNVVVLPVFALANAGVHLAFGSLTQARPVRVFIGVLVARVVGKPIGIVAAVWLLRRPEALRHLTVGTVAAVGFTVPLLIVDAALPEGPLAVAARAGLLLASLIGALVTFIAHRLVAKPAASA